MAESKNYPASSITQPRTSEDQNSGFLLKDPLYLDASDNPCLQLVTNPLTMTNYLSWSRSIKIALKARNKLGFVDGTYSQPEDVDSDAYVLWSCVDSMVMSWIINSMSKELLEAYIYSSSSSRKLWLELEEKFGQGDKIQVFIIKKQLAQMKQGNDSLNVYSNKLKKLWEMLNFLEPRPRCTCSGCKCDINKKLEEIESSNQVMQFLMGLNESYNYVVSNILLLDPLPAFNKTYSIISRIERQKTDAISSVSVNEGSALAVKISEKNTMTGKNFFNKKDNSKKGDRFCTHCSKMGHLEDACFKKHGYPDWFKDLKNQRP